jgi:hypothetical protein
LLSLRFFSLTLTTASAGFTTIISISIPAWRLPCLGSSVELAAATVFRGLLESISWKACLRPSGDLSTNESKMLPQT